MQSKWVFLAAGVATIAISALFTAGPPANPPVRHELTVEARQQVPASVSASLRRACYDCHSNSTRWPWYSQVPPGKWVVAEDVARARGAMNFSEWPDPIVRGSRAPGLLLAACAVLRGGKMPPERYLILHPDAKLAPAEIDAVCEWSRSEAVRLAQLRRR